jgi:hypothetical protein
MTASQTRSRERALEEFIARVGRIEDALETIKAANDEHYDLSPKEINWGHVGDVGRVLQGLEEIIATIQGD